MIAADGDVANCGNSYFVSFCDMEPPMLKGGSFADALFFVAGTALWIMVARSGKVTVVAIEGDPFISIGDGARNSSAVDDGCHHHHHCHDDDGSSDGARKASAVDDIVAVTDDGAFESVSITSSSLHSCKA